MMRFLRITAIISVFAGFCQLRAQAQATPAGQESGTTLNVLYRNEVSGKIFATTRGYGILFRQGKHVTSAIKSYYEIDLQTLRHPKDQKISGDSENRRRYVYGKLNSVMLLHGSLGLQNVLYQKGDLKAVEVRYAYSIGPTLAFAKPYYIEVFSNLPTHGKPKSTHVRFDSENFFPDSSHIVGRSPFTEGLAELKVYPGLNARFNLSFEYAPYTNIIRAIETGIGVDYFPRAVPMLTRNPAENFIITFQIGFVFGRKWF